MTIDCKYISPPTSNSQMEFSEQCPFFSASRLFTSGATLDIQTTVATVVVSLHISLFWIGLDDKHRNPNFNKEEEQDQVNCENPHWEKFNQKNIHPKNNQP